MGLTTVSVEDCDETDQITLPVKLAFNVKYPEGYPDELPELSAEPLEGDLDEDEVEQLLQGLRTLVFIYDIR